MKKLLPIFSLVVLLVSFSQTYAINIGEGSNGCGLKGGCTSGVSSTKLAVNDTIVNGVNLGSCKSYFDGCNNCSIGDNGVAACTQMACITNGTPKCLDKNVDNQLIDIDNSGATQELSANFELKKFSSCDNFVSVISKYVKDYTKLYPNRRGVLYDDVMLDGVATPQAVEKSSINFEGSSVSGISSNSTADSKNVSATDFSQTNIQVAGVDESEIIKTDGKNIYFYNELTHSIYIAKAFPATELQILKVIKVPESFNTPEIYINGKKLIIVANKYSQGNFSYYWFSRQQKTVLVSYDISNINSLKIEKYYQVDGYVTKSRRIGKYVYILSQSSFAFPYETYYTPLMKAQPVAIDDAKLDKDFNVSKVLPKKAELRITSNTSEQNVKIKGKAAPYNLSQGYTSQCSDIEYVMPDEATLGKFDFNPSYVTLSIINTENPSEPVKTKLLFGDVNEVYMSLDNLYITSNLYTSYNFKCPVIQCIKAPCPQYDCMMPVYNAGENTLIHKISLSGSEANYKASTIVPGSPLNQYSMDQASDGAFRIVTTSYSPEHSTNVFVLDKNLKSIGKLTGLAKNENFQSSRFIGDKLYLVTFQQIDPLFVIDLSKDSNPTVLGELKIPGYSTYLHPYDENHLIGLGYDTKDSGHGGVMNGGLKIDLYDVSDIKNPKQQYTLTIGDQGSTSDVLNNPRLFTWNAKEKLLFMPATLYKSANDKNNTWRHSDAFQGSMAIKIDEATGIKRLAEVTHINAKDLDKQRQEDCAQYTSTETPKCEKLLNGQEYCPPVNTYVPEYCYASSTTGEYFASQIWNYSNEFITRNLYLDNIWYTISNSKIQANDIKDSFNKLDEVEMK